MTFKTTMLRNWSLSHSHAALALAGTLALLVFLSACVWSAVRFREWAFVAIAVGLAFVNGAQFAWRRFLDFWAANHVALVPFVLSAVYLVRLVGYGLMTVGILKLASLLVSEAGPDGAYEEPGMTSWQEK